MAQAGGCFWPQSAATSLARLALSVPKPVWFAAARTVGIGILALSVPRKEILLDSGVLPPLALLAAAMLPLPSLAADLALSALAAAVFWQHSIAMALCTLAAGLVGWLWHNAWWPPDVGSATEALPQPKPSPTGGAPDKSTPRNHHLNQPGVTAAAQAQAAPPRCTGFASVASTVSQFLSGALTAILPSAVKQQQQQQQQHRKMSSTEKLLSGVGALRSGVHLMVPRALSPLLQEPSRETSGLQRTPSTRVSHSLSQDLEPWSHGSFLLSANPADALTLSANTMMGSQRGRGSEESEVMSVRSISMLEPCNPSSCALSLSHSGDPEALAAAYGPDPGSTGAGTGAGQAGKVWGGEVTPPPVVTPSEIQQSSLYQPTGPGSPPQQQGAVHGPARPDHHGLSHARSGTLDVSPLLMALPSISKRISVDRHHHSGAGVGGHAAGSGGPGLHMHHHQHHHHPQHQPYHPHCYQRSVSETSSGLPLLPSQQPRAVIVPASADDLSIGARRSSGQHGSGDHMGGGADAGVTSLMSDPVIGSPMERFASAHSHMVLLDSNTDYSSVSNSSTGGPSLHALALGGAVGPVTPGRSPLSVGHTSPRLSPRGASIISLASTSTPGVKGSHLTATGHTPASSVTSLSAESKAVHEGPGNTPVVPARLSAAVVDVPAEVTTTGPSLPPTPEQLYPQPSLAAALGRFEAPDDAPDVCEVPSPQQRAATILDVSHLTSRDTAGGDSTAGAVQRLISSTSTVPSSTDLVGSTDLVSSNPNLVGPAAPIRRAAFIDWAGNGAGRSSFEASAEAQRVAGAAGARTCTAGLHEQHRQRQQQQVQLRGAGSSSDKERGSIGSGAGLMSTEGTGLASALVMLTDSLSGSHHGASLGASHRSGLAASTSQDSELQGSSTTTAPPTRRSTLATTSGGGAEPSSPVDHGHSSSGGSGLPKQHQEAAPSSGSGTGVSLRPAPSNARPLGPSLGPSLPPAAAPTAPPPRSPAAAALLAQRGITATATTTSVIARRGSSGAYSSGSSLGNNNLSSGSRGARTITLTSPFAVSSSASSELPDQHLGLGVDPLGVSSSSGSSGNVSAMVAAVTAAGGAATAVRSIGSNQSRVTTMSDHLRLGSHQASLLSSAASSAAAAATESLVAMVSRAQQRLNLNNSNNNPDVLSPLNPMRAQPGAAASFASPATARTLPAPLRTPALSSPATAHLSGTAGGTGTAPGAGGTTVVTHGSHFGPHVMGSHNDRPPATTPATPPPLVIPHSTMLALATQELARITSASARAASMASASSSQQILSSSNNVTLLDSDPWLAFLRGNTGPLSPRGGAQGGTTSTTPGGVVTPATVSPDNSGWLPAPNPAAAPVVPPNRQPSIATAAGAGLPPLPRTFSSTAAVMSGGIGGTLSLAPSLRYRGKTQVSALSVKVHAHPGSHEEYAGRLRSAVNGTLRSAANASLASALAVARASQSRASQSQIQPSVEQGTRLQLSASITPTLSPTVGRVSTHTGHTDLNPPSTTGAVHSGTSAAVHSGGTGVASTGSNVVTPGSTSSGAGGLGSVLSIANGSTNGEVGGGTHDSHTSCGTACDASETTAASSQVTSTSLITTATVFGCVQIFAWVHGPAGEQYLQAVQAAQGSTAPSSALLPTSDASFHPHQQHMLHVNPAALNQPTGIALARGGSGGGGGSGSLSTHQPQPFHRDQRHTFHHDQHHHTFSDPHHTFPDQGHTFHDDAAAAALQGLLHQAAAALAIQPEFNALTPQEQAGAVAAAAAAAAQAAGLPLVVQGPPTADMLAALPDAGHLQGVDIQSGGVMQHYPPGTTAVPAGYPAVLAAVQPMVPAAEPMVQPGATAATGGDYVTPVVPPAIPVPTATAPATVVPPAAVHDSTPCSAVPGGPFSAVQDTSGALLPLQAQTLSPNTGTLNSSGSHGEAGQHKGSSSAVALECVWSPCVAMSDHEIAEVEIAMTVAEDIALRVVISRTDAVVLDAVVPLTAGQQQCVRLQLPPQRQLGCLRIALCPEQKSPRSKGVLMFDTAMLLVVPPDVASELQELVQVMRIDYARAASPAPGAKGDTLPPQHSVLVGTDAQLAGMQHSGLVQHQMDGRDGEAAVVHSSPPAPGADGNNGSGNDGGAAAVAAGVWRTHYAPLISDLAFVMEHALCPPPTLAERQALLVQVAALVPDLEAFLQANNMSATMLLLQRATACIIEAVTESSSSAYEPEPDGSALPGREPSLHLEGAGSAAASNTHALHHTRTGTTASSTGGVAAQTIPDPNMGSAAVHYDGGQRYSGMGGDTTPGGWGSIAYGTAHGIPSFSIEELPEEEQRQVAFNDLRLLAASYQQQEQEREEQGQASRADTAASESSLVHSRSANATAEALNNNEDSQEQLQEPRSLPAHSSALNNDWGGQDTMGSFNLNSAVQHMDRGASSSTSTPRVADRVYPTITTPTTTPPTAEAPGPSASPPSGDSPFITRAPSLFVTSAPAEVQPQQPRRPFSLSAFSPFAAFSAPPEDSPTQGGGMGSGGGLLGGEGEAGAVAGDRDGDSYNSREQQQSHRHDSNRTSEQVMKDVPSKHGAEELVVVDGEQETLEYVKEQGATKGGADQQEYGGLNWGDSSASSATATTSFAPTPSPQAPSPPTLSVTASSVGGYDDVARMRASYATSVTTHEEMCDRVGSDLPHIDSFSPTHHGSSHTIHTPHSFPRPHPAPKLTGLSAYSGFAAAQYQQPWGSPGDDVPGDDQGTAGYPPTPAPSLAAPAAQASDALPISATVGITEDVTGTAGGSNSNTAGTTPPPVQPAPALSTRSSPPTPRFLLSRPSALTSAAMGAGAAMGTAGTTAGTDSTTPEGGALGGPDGTFVPAPASTSPSPLLPRSPARLGAPSPTLIDSITSPSDASGSSAMRDLAPGATVVRVSAASPEPLGSPGPYPTSYDLSSAAGSGADSASSFKGGSASAGVRGRPGLRGVKARAPHQQGREARGKGVDPDSNAPETAEPDSNPVKVVECLVAAETALPGPDVEWIQKNQQGPPEVLKGSTAAATTATSPITTNNNSASAAALPAASRAAESGGAVSTPQLQPQPPKPKYWSPYSSPFSALPPFDESDPEQDSHTSDAPDPHSFGDQVGAVKKSEGPHMSHEHTLKLGSSQRQHSLLAPAPSLLARVRVPIHKRASYEDAASSNVAGEISAGAKQPVGVIADSDTTLGSVRQYTTRGAQSTTTNDHQSAAPQESSDLKTDGGQSNPGQTTTTIFATTSAPAAAAASASTRFGKSISRPILESPVASGSGSFSMGSGGDNMLRAASCTSAAPSPCAVSNLCAGLVSAGSASSINAATGGHTSSHSGGHTPLPGVGSLSYMETPVAVIPRRPPGSASLSVSPSPHQQHQPTPEAMVAAAAHQLHRASQRDTSASRQTSRVSSGTLPGLTGPGSDFDALVSTPVASALRQQLGSSGGEPRPSKSSALTASPESTTCTGTSECSSKKVSEERPSAPAEFRAEGARGGVSVPKAPEASAEADVASGSPAFGAGLARQLRHAMLGAMLVAFVAVYMAVYSHLTVK